MLSTRYFCCLNVRFKSSDRYLTTMVSTAKQPRKPDGDDEHRRRPALYRVAGGEDDEGINQLGQRQRIMQSVTVTLTLKPKFV